ncbi:unnamed protein product [Protopolystoma xenopodis]|uniref:Uncharacterized protein n=1 Tax=Protopolystoma xenopodis TaxID=117903 RepID=A0A448XSH5_9PLAT|nr:unnamed protein product [Protopolystoma xenopodis]
MTDDRSPYLDREFPDTSQLFEPFRYLIRPIYRFRLTGIFLVDSTEESRERIKKLFEAHLSSLRGGSGRI